MTRAIVMLSGGIDSATALFLTKQQTDDLFSINIVYSNSHDAEAEAAKRIAQQADVKEHLTILLPFFKDIERRYHPRLSTEFSPGYLPARNITFYGVAATYAETLNANLIVFGSNADDSKELPDARPAFVQLMNELIRTGTRAGKEGVEIRAINPLLSHTKAQVLKLALELQVPLELTWSCHRDGPRPCGECHGCVGRQKAFEQLGVPDPLFCAEKNVA